MAKTKTPLRRSPRKHPEPVKGAKEKKPRGKYAKEPALPPIKWQADEGKLIWGLLEQMGVTKNRLVLFGKDKEDPNTSGDSKIAVYKRIGSVILPDLYKIAPNSLGKRIKGKAEDLVNAYKSYAKELQVTGGGLRQEVDDGEGVHEFLECYITPDGPDHDTTEKARNLWEDITGRFPYFPTMHKMLAARSNIVPPVLTTGVGPQGRKVVHLQPPTQDPNIDPSLQATPHGGGSFIDLEPASSPIDITSSPTPAAPSRVDADKSSDHASTFSRAVSKARSAHPRYGKPSFEEKIIDLQTNMAAKADKREEAKLELDRRRLKLDEMNQLLKLLELKVIDIDVFRVRQDIIEATYSAASRRQRSPSPEAGPSKKRRHVSSDSPSSSSSGSFPGSDPSLGSR